VCACTTTSEYPCVVSCRCIARLQMPAQYRAGCYMMRCSRKSRGAANRTVHPAADVVYHFVFVIVCQSVYDLLAPVAPCINTRHRCVFIGTKKLGAPQILGRPTIALTFSCRMPTFFAVESVISQTADRRPVKIHQWLARKKLLVIRFW